MCHPEKAGLHSHLFKGNLLVKTQSTFQLKMQVCVKVYSGFQTLPLPGTTAMVFNQQTGWLAELTSLLLLINSSSPHAHGWPL